MIEGKLGIIWTLDRICKWQCNYCCVDAFGVKIQDRNLQITSNRFNHTEKQPKSRQSQDIFRRANQILQDQGLALTLTEKMKILDNLQGANIEIGFSGGDPLLVQDNFQVIRRASDLFGRSNIGLTVTGIGIKLGKVENYLEHIAQLEFTYDSPVDDDENHQQPGYNRTNLEGFGSIVDACKKEQVVTQALIPISNTNKDPNTVDLLYSTLRQSRVDKVYLMRTFPVGRGSHSQTDILQADDYRRVIQQYKQLQIQTSGPEVNVMCALRALYPDTDPDPCTFLRSTIDLTSTGDLIADAFAYGPTGEPLLPELVFGNLRKDKFADLISQDRLHRLADRIGENPGHCKVFAYLSNRSAGIDGFFTRTDPLYMDQS
ncbi:hypothetical protein KKA02_00230 [Patescibacteria group bacterium]|nr:hypothetical protein [Patescibacteria group bacterium]MCG2702067.1 hypothetical protein [Candidatus Parcubacteria bacterium]MBU4210442.1 hypothetical protein [Patescibacteria group bacterium]MBU4264600.1 hypothetical protein [Patescibacteria group bacterium]MBU4390660.1 hypothetical protein [Patescibacteria group bacterium]